MQRHVLGWRRLKATAKESSVRAHTCRWGKATFFTTARKEAMTAAGEVEREQTGTVR